MNKPNIILQEMIILAFARYSECRDLTTKGHLENVGDIAVLLCRELSKFPKYASFLCEQNIQYIKSASIMHDIGKIHILDSILLKPGPLSYEEYEAMKQHIILDDEVIKSLESIIQGKVLLDMVLNVVNYHHESYDGTGYICGLSGDSIPLEAQITALADVYDAIRSKRCYKDAKVHEVARDIIISYRGTKFSNEMVDSFLLAEEDIKSLYLKDFNISISSVC